MTVKGLLELTGSSVETMVLVLSLVSRLLEPINAFIDDVINLDPVLLQLLAFTLLLGGVYALVAVGLTLVFGVMDVVNFAHGMFLVLGMYFTLFVSETLGISPFVALPFAVVGVFAVGALLEWLAMRPIIDEPQHNQLIVTFGLLLILQSAIEIRFGPNPRSFGLNLGSYEFFGTFIPKGQFYAFVLAVVAAGILGAFLYRTQTGRAIRGTADNRVGAQYVGIQLGRIDMLTFGIGAAIAGLAGAAISLYQTFTPYAGAIYLINAFVIVVIGGLGSLKGAFLGAFVVSAATVFGGFYMPGTSFNALIFAVFIIVLVFRPTGIAGGSS